LAAEYSLSTCVDDLGRQLLVGASGLQRLDRLVRRDLLVRHPLNDRAKVAQRVELVRHAQAAHDVQQDTALVRRNRGHCPVLVARQQVVQHA